MGYDDEDDAIAEVDAQLLKETSEAFLVALAEDCEEVWLPKRLVVDYDIKKINPVETSISLVLPEWLAIEKGLV